MLQTPSLTNKGLNPIPVASDKSFLVKNLYRIRDFRSRQLYRTMKKYCRGSLLDVGGWEFFLSIRKKGIPFRHWINIENCRSHLLRINEPRYSGLLGDGYRLPFKNRQIDTVLCIQVLDHVFDPMSMVREIARVLKTGGYAIFLIPQTANIHMIPEVYYNFTRYWIITALEQAELDIVELHPLGGAWSTIASRLFYFFLQSARVEYVSDRKIRRNFFFYLLFPFMAVFALISIPICLLLSLGDLREEANNHLVVARKQGGTGRSAKANSSEEKES